MRYIQLRLEKKLFDALERHKSKLDCANWEEYFEILFKRGQNEKPWLTG